MAWTKIGTTTLTSEGTSLGVTSLTDTKFIQVISHIFSGASGTATTNMHLNDVATGSEYASAYIANGGTYTPETTQNKLVYGSNTGASGAGTAPNRLEFVSKWANTSSQITSIQCTQGNSLNFEAGTIMKVWGSD